MAHIANSVNLSSGTLLFGDPTKLWTPYNFPAFPSTNLAITASGRVEDQTFSTLTFPNSITYEPFEQSTVRIGLEKTLVTDASGNVSYKTPHVGFVSSYNTTFQQPISSFTATIGVGGANIISQTDTITNAIAKLDSWITNAFLLQPPAVTPIEYVSSSLYGSTRWTNYTSINILNTSAPYTSAITFIIGDPTTPNYLTLEWTGCEYFPFMSYTDGISPVRTPLVQIRIFTDFFPKFGAKSYTKKNMPKNNMKIISEAGSCALPAQGKVFAIEDTDHNTTYTTFNFYLPNITQAYPKDTQIPVNISYMNNTMPQPNVCSTSMTIASQGPPSAPALSLSTTTTNCLTYVITPPTYSDATQQITKPYTSTYTIQYQLTGFATVFSETSGFIYGTPNRTTIPDFLSTYQTTKSYDIPYFNSTLTTNQIGVSPTPFIPAAVFETTVSANNSARLQGSPSDTKVASTLFALTTSPTLQNVGLVATGPGVVKPNSVFSLHYAPCGWQISTVVSTNVVFFSTSINLPLAAQIAVQLNDETYPGDRNPILLQTNQTDVNSITRSYGFALEVSTGTKDYTLAQPYGYQNDGNDIMYATVSETNPTLGYSHYFYNVLVETQPVISTISSTLQEVQVFLQNTKLVGLSPTETPNQVSSASYKFSTDGFGTFTYDNAAYNSTASAIVFVSGLPTASNGAQLFYSAYATNQVCMYTCNTFGTSALVRDDISVGPGSTYVSSIMTMGPVTTLQSCISVFNGVSAVTTTPWPQNVSLNYSSLTVNLDNTAFQDPICPHPFYIETTLVTPYATDPRQSIRVPLTSSFYIDTISAYSNAKFTDPRQPYGLHIQSFLPLWTTALLSTNVLSTNIADGVDCFGQTSNGLNVPYSTFISVTSSSLILNSTVLYDNTINLNSDYTSSYGRELMMVQGSWLHPTELDFTPFNAALIGLSTIFPCFNYDLYWDTNNGFRYATFLYTTTMSTPTVFNSVDIAVNNTNFIGNVTLSTTSNVFFPDAPIQQDYLQNSLVKLHVKHFATYNYNGCETIETAWINAIKQDVPSFIDTSYDEGGCFNASTIVSSMISSIEYSVLMTPRYYTNIATLVRIGISRYRDGETGDNLTFENITINYKS